MKKISSLAVLSLGVGLALTSCAGGPPESPAETTATPTAAPVGDSLDALVEAAKPEGSVRVYASTPEETLKEIAQAFTAKYGIQVEALRLGGAAMPSRFEAESQAGSPTGEVLIASQLDFLLTATEAGQLLAFEDTGITEMLPDYPDEAELSDYDGMPILQVLDTGFVYNENAVSADEIPEKWSDLDSPRWAGKYCAVAPDTTESQMVFMSTIRDSEGEDVLKSFGESIGRWYPGIVPLNEAVVSGECDLAAGTSQYFIAGAQEQGAPVEFAHAPTAVYPVTTAAIAAEAEHPNAAKLFLHFVLSPEGNALLNNVDAGSYGTWDLDELSEDFWVPTLADQDRIRGERDELLQLLGL